MSEEEDEKRNTEADDDILDLEDPDDDEWAVPLNAIDQEEDEEGEDEADNENGDDENGDTDDDNDEKSGDMMILKVMKHNYRCKRHTNEFGDNRIINKKEKRRNIFW